MFLENRINIVLIIFALKILVGREFNFSKTMREGGNNSDDTNFT